MIWQDYTLGFPLGTLLSLIVLLCTWITYKCMNVSSKRSNAPPMLPHLVPIIGHTIPFLKNSEALIRYGRKFFGEFASMFSITLMGKSIHIVTNPRLVSIVHNDTNTYDARSNLVHVLTSFGMTRKGAQTIIHRQWDTATSKLHSKSIIEIAHRLQVQQTSGHDLRKLSQHIAASLQDLVTLKRYSSSLAVRKGVQCISLKELASETIIYAMQDAYFGPKLCELDPKLPRALMEFSKLSWQVWYGLPWFLKRKPEQYSRQIRSAHRSYLELALKDRECMAWYTQGLEEECRKANVSLDDQSALMQFFHWGIAMNPAYATHWIVAHILFDPNLTSIIREETALAFKDDGSLDTFILVNRCPMLNSVWLETLRLYASVTAIRTINQNTQLGSNTLTKGGTIMFSARQLSHDAKVFGSNYESFDPLRFYRAPELQHSESFRPFGGGKLMCPGRHLAKHAILSFVAIMLRRFNVTLAFPQPFPRYFEAEPTIGIMDTHDEVFVQLEARE